MNITSIDHINLEIPEEEVETAIKFYGDDLNLGLENLEKFYNKKPFFSVRLTPESVIHIQPTDSFEEPTQNSFNHLALTTTTPLHELKESLNDNDITIEKELTPLGATGEAPAIYISDPFGYQIEIKADNQT